MRTGNLSLAAAITVVACTGVTSTSMAQTRPTRTNDIVTVVGCLERETVYRSRNADGRGGTLGTGAGAANEYVLVGARSVEPKTMKPIVGTAGVERVVYSLTGNREAELKGVVGREVSVTGFVEVDESAGTERVKDLPRMLFSDWREVSARCSPAAAQR